MIQEDIKDLPTILHLLDTISEEEETLRSDPKWGPLLSDLGVEDKFELFPEIPNGPFVLKPTSSNFNSYFRGQNEYYDNCCPTIYRNKDKKSKIDRFICRLRSSEFELLLRTHPFVKKVFDEGLLLNHPGGEELVSLKVDYLGLAQHYGFDTDMMDFTGSKWVAAFFAVSKQVNGRFVPVNSDGYGVLYRYSEPPDAFIFENGIIKTEKKFSVIGLQPFKRPGEQKGYSLKMTEDENLNSLRSIQKYFFRHDRMASEIILNRMNKGKSLFPYDELEVLSRKIKQSNKLSLQAFNLAIEKYPVENFDKEMLKQACYDRNIKIVNYPVVEFDKHLEKNFIRYWRVRGEKDFLSKIVYRLTAHQS
jgi:hypothetical protein